MKSFIVGSALVLIGFTGWEIWSNDMKNFVPFVAGAVLVGLFYGGWELLRTIPSYSDTLPSEEANTLIASMLSGKGWRIGKNYDCIVNDVAKVIIYPGYKASVRSWPVETNWTFTASDLYWIGKNYPEARKKLQEAAINPIFKRKVSITNLK